MSNFKEDLKKVKAFVFDIDGVLSAQVLSINANGDPMRTANIKDGFALHMAVKAGYPIAIITGGDCQNIVKRYNKLGITDIYMGSFNKLERFREWISKYDITPDEIMYMGDDLPDYPVMEVVGVPVAPADAAEEIKSLCKYISDKNGGEGCVRDVIEQVLRVQGKWSVEHKW
ncbi:MAG: HAD hydrolase family protein [Chlorobi bacterium]|nr:HAD hydrolase family protein [Chlorobiota bacterium]